MTSAVIPDSTNIIPYDISVTQGYTPATSPFGPSPISPDDVYNVGYSPVVPDTTGLNLPGQLPGIPGGGASNGGSAASDPSGINVLHTDPTVNPTPTGGYMQALAQVAAAASQSFTTYVKGSPSVAIPAARTPLSTISGALSLTSATGQTNWTTVFIIVGILGVGGFLLIKYV